MKRWFLFVLLFSAPTTVLADCRENWICVETISLGDEIALLARNLADYPITYTLKLRDPYRRGRVSDTVTRTLAPKQSEQVIEVPSANGGGSGKVHFS